MKEKCIILNQCPVCFAPIAYVETIRETTKAKKHVCVNCGSLLLMPIQSRQHTKLIRKGAKK